jgi:uncharacterized protein YceK
MKSLCIALAICLLAACSAAPAKPNPAQQYNVQAAQPAAVSTSPLLKWDASVEHFFLPLADLERYLIKDFSLLEFDQALNGTFTEKVLPFYNNPIPEVPSATAASTTTTKK